MRVLQKASAFLIMHRQVVRSVYAETLLENFFVAAVTSVLAIRLYLHLTGYPRIQVGEVHVAHVLLGGLGMLVAVVILLGFLNRSAKEYGAIVGGIGFGAFIDELGKLITSANDYFYEPTIALIYVAFVLLFYFIRFVSRYETLSERECVANAFEIAKNASISGLDSEERQLAFGLLEGCAKDNPAQPLKSILLGMAPASSRRPLIARSKGLINRFYAHITTKWWFGGGVVGFFAFVSVTSLYTLVAVIQWSWALALWIGGGLAILAALFWSRRGRARHVNILVSVAMVIVSILMTWAILGSLKEKPLSILVWAQLVFPSISGAIMVLGLVLIPVSRLRAYRMFRRAILVTIFFTQVLTFYQQHFLALAGLLVNVAILLGLRYMINNEELKLGGEPETAGVSDKG